MINQKKGGQKLDKESYAVNNPLRPNSICDFYEQLEKQILKQEEYVRTTF